jgi:hypothetical protein
MFVSILAPHDQRHVGVLTLSNHTHCAITDPGAKSTWKNHFHLFESSYRPIQYSLDAIGTSVSPSSSVIGKQTRLTHTTVKNVPETQSNVVGAIDRLELRIYFTVPKENTIAMETSL